MAEKKVSNPFILTPFLPDDYFCSRREDSDKIMSLLKSDKDVVLIGPRRIGKTCLLNNLLRQPSTMRQFNVLYVDLFNTKNADDFIMAMRSAMVNPLYSSFPDECKKKFNDVVKHFKAYGEINLKILKVGGEKSKERVKGEESLFEQVFRVLETTDKPNIVVFDEFQQIDRYPEKITELLRSKMQATPNTRFVFSGSYAHMLINMFCRENQPFYNSAAMHYLSGIPAHTYARFCNDLFRQYKKGFEAEAGTFVQNLFLGDALCMQKAMSQTFAETPAYDTAGVPEVKKAIRHLLEWSEALYAGQEMLLSPEENRVLECIALEGVVTSFEDDAFREKYGLGDLASTLQCVKALRSDEKYLLDRVNRNAYILADRFQELWIADRYGVLDQKFDMAVANKKRYDDLSLTKPVRKTLPSQKPEAEAKTPKR